MIQRKDTRIWEFRLKFYLYITDRGKSNACVFAKLPRSCLTLYNCMDCSPPVALQSPLSMGFSWQEYWSELPFPPPGDFSNLEIGPESLMSPALAGGAFFFITSATWEPQGKAVFIAKFLI